MPELLNSKIGIAASAGLDSTLLIYLCHEMDLDFSICHVNFQLRGGESEEDENFLQDLAYRMGADFYFKKTDTKTFAKSHGISIQMAARKLRYEFFKHLKEENKIDYVLTAHHLDDQIETFLINIGRGTGFRGLSGIPAQQEYLKRPFLNFAREEILIEAKKRDIKWREDSSNSESKYLRNKLRHDVIPQLKDALPDLQTSFIKTIGNLQSVQNYVDGEVLRFRESGITETQSGFIIELSELKKTSNPSFILYELVKDYQFNPADLENLLTAETGKALENGKHRLLKNRNQIICYELADLSDDLSITGEGEYKLDGKHFLIDSKPVHNLKSFIENFANRSTLLLDANKIKFPLILRTWQAGDRLRPFGMKGSKLVSDVLVDAKTSRVEKDRCLVLENEDTILWVVGYRHGSTAKIDAQTKTALVIRYTE
jgi:tRNA(Ile)-lysidine synthase